VGTYAHTIKALKVGNLPRRFVVIACAPVVAREGARTPLFIHRLRCGALTYLHRDGHCTWTWRSDVFHSGDELMRLLDRYTSHREITWLVAHDLSYHLVVSELWMKVLTGAIHVEGYNLTGRYCSVRFRVSNKVIHGVDSSNYCDKPWEWICAALGTNPGATPSDTDTDSQALDAARLQTASVCELVQTVCEMSRDHGQNSWGWSLGSLAWQCWRRGTMGDAVHVHADEQALTLERESYLGGRTECRYLGEVNSQIYVCDYNSLYAHVMTDAMPVQLHHVSRDDTVQSLRAGLAAGRLAIARVGLDSKTHDYPYFFWPGKGDPPARQSRMPNYLQSGGQYAKIWGRGRFTTTLASPELRRALDAGEVGRVDQVAWYTAGDPFGSFVADWYARRLDYRAKGRALEESVCKRILTILPGKFGQWAREWLDCKERKAQLPLSHWHERDPETGEYTLWRTIGGLCQYYHSPGEWKHSCPAISAHVCSAARVLTDTAVEIAGPLDCYHFDCDALHVSRVGFDRLVESGLVDDVKLGRLKLKDVYDGGAYRNVGDYTLGRKLRQERGESISGSSDAPTRPAANPSSTTGFANHYHDPDTEFSAVSGGSVLANMLGSGPDAWRSLLFSTARRRNRYVGRVGLDGWVRPLWLPQQWTKPEQERMFDDEIVPDE
jgi:DNA polymerase type B, organellar and viral